ncbi:hypothetical protein [Vulgatibacter sp.]|uniref:hypothetical protein n=1 Tax=Vulgatibacter sp. TaxID=1971226 RepID=UPI00356A406A
MRPRIPIQEAPEIDALQLELLRHRQTVAHLRRTLADERIERDFGDVLPRAAAGGELVEAELDRTSTLVEALLRRPGADDEQEKGAA